MSGPGGSDTHTQIDYITVSDPTVISAFSATPLLGVSPLAVDFTDASTGNIATHSWDFGDGATSSEVSPTHSYVSAGTYTVSLTVSGPGGSDTHTQTDYITVSDPTVSITVSFQEGVEGYTGAKDTWLSAYLPSLNNGSDNEITIDGRPDYSALLYWDLSNIPQSSTVSSVEITVSVTNSSGQQYQLFELNRNWEEQEATWEEYVLGQSWEISGVVGPLDRNNIVLGDISSTGIGFKTFILNNDGTSLVQSWVNNPSSNKGFVLLNYINRNGLTFESRESITPQNRPKISITYSQGSEKTSNQETFRSSPSVQQKSVISNELVGNYPNPFYTFTSIKYAISEENEVFIVIYDIQGNTKAILVDEQQSAGVHTISFKGNQLPEGVYFLKMTTNNYSKTLKMLIIKD